MTAKIHILALLAWALLQSAAACDTGDMCIAVRPCDNAQNIGSLDKKLDELQAALNSLKEQIGVIPGARSCKQLKEGQNVNEDGIYRLTTAAGEEYQTFCDMTTAGGGWTLVASVHENNMNGKCTAGDRWTSEQGSNANLPGGDGNWANRNTFGTAEGATSDDFKNPGYSEIEAGDVAVWHVPNITPVRDWKTTTILRYHTTNQFLSGFDGNLFNLFQRYPVKYDAGACQTDNGPSIPITYDFGNNDTVINFYGPNARGEFTPGYISFRAFNTERAALAMCSGSKPTGCNIEHNGAEPASTCSACSCGSEVNVYTELRDLRALVGELSAKLTITQEQLQQQSAAVAELKRENTERPKVAFSAALLSSEDKDYGLINTETNLVFGKVLTNVGNAYNPITGVFTAPVKGVYYFRFTGYAFASQNMGLSIFKGNERMMSAYEYKSSGDTTDVISNGVTLLLEVGDVIYMRLWVNSWVRIDSRYDYSSFSGFLLFPI